MALVKAGARYFYNDATGVIYPWSPDLEKIKGLTLFTPRTSGEFNTGMMLAGDEPPAEAPKVKTTKVTKTVRYKAEAPIAPAVDTVEVPTASGSSRIPAVHLTPSAQSDV